MKREGANHAKFRIVAAELSIPVAYVRGILESLWLLTGINYPAGDIGRLSNRAIAAGIEWDPNGDADRLIEVLIEARLIDPMPDEQGRLYVHDWHDHCDDAIHMRLMRHVQTFASGVIP